MKQLQTRSTSRSSAVCDPIVVREGEHVRLAFIPSLVDNPSNPRASVNGTFVYQRKAASEKWIPLRTLSLSSLRDGDQFKLTLHADELFNLLQKLVPLYKLYETKGVPKGQKMFVEVSPGMAKLVTAGEKDLGKLIESHPEDAAELLINLAKWLATTTGRAETVRRLVSLAPKQMPSFSALLGIAAMKEALEHWEANSLNDSEDFWQKSLSDRSYVLGQMFAYPVVVIGEKAYVGGKQVTSKGGKEVDFLAAAESTDALILIEIKTPQTKLLGSKYREDVFPFSRELAGAVAQVLRYRQSLMKNFDLVTSGSTTRFTLGEPRCVVICGSTEELCSADMRESFELQRDRFQGVSVITYDELFSRLQQLINLLESPSAAAE